jgi:hypothetical protein
MNSVVGAIIGLVIGLVVGYRRGLVSGMATGMYYAAREISDVGLDKWIEVRADEILHVLKDPSYDFRKKDSVYEAFRPLHFGRIFPQKK